LLKLSILPEEGTILNLAGSLAISPDGLKVAYVGITKEGQTSLFVRPLDSMDERKLPGTDDANFPFWSPDSNLIGFFAQGKLKKIDILGGPPQTLCDASAGRGGAWSEDGNILFSPALGDGLYRIPAAGGAVSQITVPDQKLDEATHRFPVFLPDGKHFLFVIHGVKPENSGIFLGSLDSKDKRRLLPDESICFYSPPGDLLFVREGNLVVQAFDLSSLRLSGEAVPIAEGVYYEPSAGSASLTVSRSGLLAYSTTSGNQYQQFVWFDRQGKQIGSFGDAGVLGDPTLSPDETKVAHYNFRASVSGKPDIWIGDFKQGTFTRFTFDPANDFTPIWSPDGRSIVYSTNLRGSYDIYEKSISGSGEEKVLLQSKDWKFADDLSRDGKYLIYEDDSIKTKADIWALPLFGDRKPFPVIQTEFNEAQGNLSADGKWIAYGSDETGRSEIYIQSFPGGGSKRQISTGGGSQPRWSHDQKELFYMAPDSKIMAVEIKTEETLDVGVPVPLFTAHVPLLPLIGNDRNQYVVTADGQRFLVNRLVAEGVSTPITIVFNWPKLIKK
jgi:Periplasmic component of the Tol biopolymer transport system